jgi:hypothetical protein
MTELTKEEQRGVEAIQYLQSMIAIDETAGEALAGWRAMSDDEQETTMVTYSFMLDRVKRSPEDKPEDIVARFFDA